METIPALLVSSAAAILTFAGGLALWNHRDGPDPAKRMHAQRRLIELFGEDESFGNL